MDNVKFFIKLVTIEDGQQKAQLNDMFIHVEVENDTRFLYFSDKDRVLRKINILDGREIWSYPINTDIKSICIDSNYNCYVTTNSDIRKISDSGKYVSTLNIQSDKTISDGENFYIAKGTKLSKVTTNGQEQFSYNLDANIKDIATDKVGNIYVATEKDVRKLAKKVIGDKDGKNLIRNSNFQNGFNGWGKWSNTNTTIENGECLVQPIINSPCGIITSRFNVEKGKQYTVSFDACSYYNTSVLDYNYIMYCTGGNVPINGININAGDTVIRRYSLTFTAPETKSIAIMLGKKGKQYNNDGFKITNIQVEEGDKATPYKPNKADYVNIGEWKYSINSNSIALDSENNIYIPTNSDVQKLNTQGQKIATLDIQADKIALDSEDNLYVSKDKYVEKLAKKVIGDKDSRNLIRNSNFYNGFDGWQHDNGINIININGQNTIEMSDVKDDEYIQISRDIIATEGKYYTVSCDIEGDGYIYVVPMKGQIGWTPTDSYMDNSQHFNTSKLERVNFTTSQTPKGTERINIIFRRLKGATSTKTFFSLCQLEEGTQATPYKPNSQDYVNIGEWKHIDNSEINNIAIG